MDGIIAVNNAGLCNRIKCIVNSLLKSYDVKVWWPKHLDNKVIDWSRANVEPFRDIFDSPLEVVESGEDVMALVAKGYRRNGAWLWLERGNKIDYCFNRDDSETRMIIHDMLRIYLSPSEKVRSMMTERRKLIQDCEIGVFVRTGDNQKEGHNTNYNTIENYPIGSEKKYFVVGDSPRVYEYFKNQSNVTYLPENIFIQVGLLILLICCCYQNFRT